MSRQDVSSQQQTFSLWQQTSLITSTLIGVGVLTLPRTTSAILYEAGWMSPLFGSIVAFVSVWMIAKLSQHFPGMTFIEYSTIVWGAKKTRAWENGSVSPGSSFISGLCTCRRQSSRGFLARW